MRWIALNLINVDTMAEPWVMYINKSCKDTGRYIVYAVLENKGCCSKESAIM